MSKTTKKETGRSILSKEDLLRSVETVAKLEFDGHVTIMRFTTGWKGAFGTPHMDSGELSHRFREKGNETACSLNPKSTFARMLKMKSHDSLVELLAHMLRYKPSFYKKNHGCVKDNRSDRDKENDFDRWFGTHCSHCERYMHGKHSLEFPGLCTSCEESLLES